MNKYQSKHIRVARGSQGKNSHNKKQPIRTRWRGVGLFVITTRPPPRALGAATVMQGAPDTPDAASRRADRRLVSEPAARA
jgi:hypothetical protein